MFTLTVSEVGRYLKEIYMEIVTKVQGTPSGLNYAFGKADDASQSELGIYGSFRPMIWFFIMLWSILGFVALGKFQKTLNIRQQNYSKPCQSA